MKQVADNHGNIPQRKRRADAGVVSEKPIALRLKPAERHAIEQLAQADQRTLAATCRLALLKGLPALQRQVKKVA